MMIARFVLLLAAIFASTSGHIGGLSPFQELAFPRDIPQTYCGRNLARAVAAACYDMTGFNKRGETGSMYSSVLSPVYKEQESHNWPWVPSYKALAMGNHRGKRFVVNECCEKACTISELQTYC